MSIVSEIKEEGESAVKRWALELDGIVPAPDTVGERQQRVAREEIRLGHRR